MTIIRGVYISLAGFLPCTIPGAWPHPCPATKINAKVDQEGCSGEQLIDEECLCDDTWKNHGGYVTCVAHAAEAQLEAGLL